MKYRNINKKGYNGHILYRKQQHQHNGIIASENRKYRRVSMKNNQKNERRKRKLRAYAA